MSHYSFKSFPFTCILIFTLIGLHQQTYASNGRSISYPAERKKTTTFITGYRQSPDTLEFDVSTEDHKFIYWIFSNVPDTLKREDFHGNGKKQSVTDDKIIIPLDSEPTDGEYSIVVDIGGEFFEIIRQSQTWLNETFNFNKAGGYSILGRRSIIIQTKEDIRLSPLSFVGTPELKLLKPGSTKSEPGSKYLEIQVAKTLLKQMWSEPVSLGPNATSYTDFLALTYSEKMKKVRGGDFSISCQGFRDLFIHAASSIKTFQARPVEVFNYYPPLKDLIPFSHATAEIFLSSINKWILFDPWFSIMIEEAGTPLSTKELAERTSAEGLKIISLIDVLSRSFVKKDGVKVPDIFKSSDLELTKFSCSNLHCSPGYLEYFKHVRVRGFNVRQ